MPPAPTRTHPGTPTQDGLGHVCPEPATTIMADQPNKRGRPSKLTPEIHKAIVDAIRNGASRQSAAESCNVAHSTLSEWIARGDGRDPDRPQDEDFAAFADALHAAEADFEQELVRNVVAYSAMGDKPDWRGPAWLLERRFSDRWGKVTKTELTGKNGGPVAVDMNVDVASLSDEQLRALARPSAGTEGPGGTGTPTT